MNYKKKNISFTLIELLVVIVIIGILAGVIMISTSSSINKANIAKIKVFEESINNNLAANMVSAWDADHVTKNGTIWTLNDKWGNNNGTFHNGEGVTCSATACPQIVQDKAMGNVLSFDGVDDYIDCGMSEGLNIDNAITISAWIFVERIDNWNILLGKIYGGYGYELRFINGEMNLAIGDGTSHLYPLSNLFLSTNIWTYVTASYSDDENNVLYFVNGEKNIVPTDAILNKYPTSSLRVGDRPAWTHPFKGLIKSLKIYDQSLSFSQIKQNYVLGLDSLLSDNLISKQEHDQRIQALGSNF